jgi:probable rRNA maturation factor
MKRPARASTSPAFTIAISPPTPAWRRSLPRATSLVRIAAAAALSDGLAQLPIRHALRRRTFAFEVSVVLAGDAMVRRLNRRYRGKDKPTNVLSFPADRLALPILGDVILAYGIAKREADSENKALAAHLSHLVVHGVLHRLGYDHDDDKAAAVMERLESAIMARLGFPDPYAVVPARQRKSRRR